MKTKRFKSAREIDAEARTNESKPVKCYVCGTEKPTFFDYKSGGLVVCSKCRKTSNQIGGALGI